MVWLKRLAGLLAVLLGIAGVIACLIGIASVWSIRGRLDDVVAEVSVRIDDILARVEDRASQATEYIDSAQTSTRELNERVQQRVSELRDVPLGEAADIDELERQLYSRIQLGAHWIGFIQSTMDLVEQLLQVVESASLFAEKESGTMADLVVALRDGKNEIQQTSQLVKDVKASLAEIRIHGNLDESAERITTLSQRIDTSLSKVQRHTTEFQGAIAETRDDLAGLAARTRRQIAIAAGLLSVILAWIAVAQLSLTVHGWRALHLRTPGSKCAPAAD